MVRADSYGEWTSDDGIIWSLSTPSTAWSDVVVSIQSEVDLDELGLRSARAIHLASELLRDPDELKNSVAALNVENPAKAPLEYLDTAVQTVASAPVNNLSEIEDV